MSGSETKPPQSTVPRDLLRRYMAVIIDQHGVAFWNKSIYRCVFSEDEKDLLAAIEVEATER